MSNLFVRRCFVFAAAFAIPLVGQIDRGALTGTVADSQDAVVAGAKVTLTNPATGVTLSTMTGRSGGYSFVGLVAGKYQAAYELSGFKKVVQDNVTIDVGRTTGLNVKLQPGALSESITVTEQAPLLDTETSDVGTSVTRKDIIDLPVPLTSDSRNPLSFVVLTPGVSGSIPGATPDLRLHVNGTPTGSSEVYFDGIPVSDTNLSGNIQANHPSIESIGEVQDQQ